MPITDCSTISLFVLHLQRHSRSQNIVRVNIKCKLSINEHIDNIFKTANKKLNDLNRINSYMKQNQRQLLVPSFVTCQFSYYYLT